MLSLSVYKLTTTVAGTRGCKIIETLNIEREEERLIWEIPNHVASHSGKINIVHVKIEYEQSAGAT